MRDELKDKSRGAAMNKELDEIRRLVESAFTDVTDALQRLRAVAKATGEGVSLPGAPLPVMLLKLRSLTNAREDLMEMYHEREDVERVYREGLHSPLGGWK